MSLKMRPLLDRVVVKPNPAMTVTDGGLHIPESVQDKPQRGLVIAVGEGKEDEPMILRPNDLVLYAKNAGTLVEVNNEELLIMRQCDVFSILENE